MRTAVGLLVLVMAATSASAQSTRERTLRTLDLIEELGVDDATTGKLLPVLTAYDSERDRLVRYQTELTAKLRGTDDPTQGDLILDQQLATHRLLLAAEATLVTQLRQLLPAQQAARARVILFTPPAASEPVRRARYRTGDLFPPGSPFAGPCDPFGSMHGC